MISICIPCYEMSGFGSENLNIGLQSIYSQSYKDYEVIVSDHSLDNLVENVCKYWKNKLPIKYFRNENMRGSSSANSNNAIRMAQGDLIKIFFQDDYFKDQTSLQTIIDNFDYDKQWLVGSYIHTTDRKTFTQPHYPSISDNIMFINRIGFTSCLTFKNGYNLYFDDNLIWFMDSEFYYRLYKKFGLPKILNDPTMVQLLWDGQVTNTLATEEVRMKEYIYLVEKYKGEL
jgi:glycosyltransferase involved in cell wall biosynthesis